MKTSLLRRDFLKLSAGLTAASPLLVNSSWGEVAVPAGAMSRIVVVHGKDIPKMIATGMERMGGWSAFIKPGMKVVMKPNLAWARTPEVGANTHPDLLGSCIRAAFERGAKTVSIPENTCAPEQESFRLSGALDAVKGTQARLYRPAKGDYKATTIPRGVTLKEARIPADILACDCLINMPVAKVHSASGITVAMKNWMGSVDDRRPWHREGLHQCIADYCTVIKPHLVIVDATRILMSKGPQGPGDLAYPNELIFSTDIVAADAYAATLLKKTPLDIGYIRIAQEMGLGCADLTKMQIERVEA